MNMNSNHTFGPVGNSYVLGEDPYLGQPLTSTQALTTSITQDHDGSTSSDILQQPQTQCNNMVVNSYHQQSELLHSDLHNLDFQPQQEPHLLGLLQQHPNSTPISAQSLINSFASEDAFGPASSHQPTGYNFNAQSYTIHRRHTYQSPNPSPYATNGFGSETTPITYSPYAPLNLGRHAMGISPFSFQKPQDTSAARALAQLAQGPTANFLDQSVCDFDAACDQACDPNLVTNCAIIESEPCYDPACPDRCEVDGADMTCVEPHSLKPSSQTMLHLNHYGAISSGTFTSQRLLPDPDLSNQQQSIWQCSHEEHIRTGCINPLQVMKRWDTTMMPPTDCCCENPQHKPNANHGSRKRRRTEAREVEKSQPRRVNYHQISSESMTYGDNEYSSTGHSRNSSINTGIPEQSPSTPLSFWDTHQDQIMSRMPSNELVCYWVNPISGKCCSTAFESTKDLQKHVVNDHIDTGKTTRRPKVKSEHCCRWRGCDAAILQKPFRQVQHLKDHVRTHTQFKPFLCDCFVEGKRCNKEFGDKKALDSHKRSHTSEKPFRCPECLKDFSHQSSLATHRQQHQAEKKYRCLICRHTDNDRANISRHLDIHYANRYSCVHCLKAFSKKANGNRHLKNKSCPRTKEIYGNRELTSAEINAGITELPRSVDLTMIEVIQ